MQKVFIMVLWSNLKYKVRLVLKKISKKVKINLN